MEIRPILSALLRHKTAAALIILEIAVSCAIVSNAVFVIGSRIGHMHRESGLAESELVVVDVSSIQPDRNADAMRLEDIAAMSAVPGVRAVTSLNQFPYGGNVWASGVSLDPEQTESSTITATQYMDDGSLLETFGLRLIDGRNFTADEYIDQTVLDAPGSEATVPAVILGEDLAKRLFGTEKAVGQNIYVYGSTPIRVVGVVERLLAPGQGESFPDYDSMIFPVRVSQGSYVLRTEPARRAEVLEAAIAALNQVNPNRIVDNQRSLEAMRSDFYSRDRAVVWLLGVVCAALLAVTALGIVGLASFWVQQRTKQIGVRRALGATKTQILRYFQTENFLLATIGIAVGMLMAYGINQMLMTLYALPRLPLHYLPIGAAMLWVLGQVAVFGPARRAADVPPAIATRSA